MHRSVTARPWAHAVALVVGLLLAVCTMAGSGPASTTESVRSAATQQSAGPSTSEHEDGPVDCRGRRSARALTSPPAPVERPVLHTEPAPREDPARRHAPFPGLGCGGLPWHRQVEVPVLHQVFRL
ncbi:MULTISPECIES: hypothetical protein [Streptomyces]|uniref:hypothetical protein n=1 Tax=Streptomyces TaxID=1883 RepID=UPI0004C7DCC8|nr:MULTISPECIES: hypothetical protein [Streptomyces]